jgi:hypothetical protein
MSKVSKPYTKRTKEERERYRKEYERIFGKKKPEKGEKS